MSATDTTGTSWGPLSEPIHGPVPDGRPPWKDNAYLAFWDAKADAFGVFHFSTSPNAEGRRARVSLQAAGRTVEIIEEPDPGTFTTASIDFDLADTFTASGDRLSGSITTTPHHAIADYNTGVVPELVPGEPLMHYQRAARVRGSFVIEGETVEIDGFGLRDRTWGYRDESVSFVEYIGLMAVFGDHTLACMTFLGPDGTTKTSGFRLGEDEASTVPISGMSVTRDASGLYAAGGFTVDGADDIAVETVDRHAGFWVPMGVRRSGPTMASYDEFVTLRTPDGSEAVALVEQGQIRRLH